MPAVSFQTIALQAGIKLKLRGNVMTDTVKGHFLSRSQELHKVLTLPSDSNSVMIELSDDGS